MKFVVQAVLGFTLCSTAPAFAVAPAPSAQAAVSGPAHVKAVQDLLGAMQSENVVRGVAGRSRYASDAQRKAVFAKLDKTPPAEMHRHLAPALSRVISADTAIEMTRFYGTPYGKQVLHRKYNSSAQIMMPGARPVVAPEEKKERKRAAYVNASKQLTDAEPVIQHEAFKLVQQLSKEK